MEKENRDEILESEEDISAQGTSEQDTKESDVIEDTSSIDALLYDSDEELYTPETFEETAHFNDFLKEYNAIVKKNRGSYDPSSVKFPEQYSIFPEENTPRNQKGKQSAEEAYTDDWYEEITLAPATYADPDEDDNIFLDTPIAEEDDGIREEDDEDSVTYTFDNNAQPECDEEEEVERKYDPDNPRIIDSVFDFIELFVLTLVAVMVLTTFVFKHSVVEGSSMYSTLEDGDHLIITDLFYTPERGDIVVFEDYSTRLKKAVVKRVIGLPGETVEVTVDTSGEYVVRINGEILEEDYDYTDVSHSSPTVGTWVVEEGEVFVMGDNRYNSTDSREIGPIDIDTILGKVILRFFPLNKFGGVD